MRRPEIDFRKEMFELRESFDIRLVTDGDIYDFREIPESCVEGIYMAIVAQIREYGRHCIIGRTKCSITIEDYTRIVQKA